MHRASTPLSTQARCSPMCALEETAKVRVAMGSAACDNVINPGGLPSDAEYVPNEDDQHFVGASNSPIERYGSCKTVMGSKRGKVGCTWQMAASPVRSTPRASWLDRKVAPGSKTPPSTTGSAMSWHQAV